MNRSAGLLVPRTLSFVVVAAATFAGPWVACNSSTSSGTTSGGGTSSTTTTSSDETICIVAADAGPHQKCPDMIDAGEQCPPGCETEVV